MADQVQRRSSNEVVEFPTSQEQQLRSAISDAARGEHSSALKKFIALIDDGCSAAYDFVGVYYELGAVGLAIERIMKRHAFITNAQLSSAAAEKLISVLRVSTTSVAASNKTTARHLNITTWSHENLNKTAWRT